MTTNIALETARIEDLVREIEDENVQTVAQLAERTNLNLQEFAALVGELIASRKLTSEGGMRMTLRGNSDVQGVKGFYRRMKWKFSAEIGSPQRACTENEMKEAAQRVIGFVMQKIGGDFEQLYHEMKMRDEAAKKFEEEKQEKAERPN